MTKKVYKQYLKGFESISLDTQEMKCRVHFTKLFESDTVRELNKQVKEFIDSFKSKPTLNKKIRYKIDNGQIEVLQCSGSNVPEFITSENLFNYVK